MSRPSFGEGVLLALVAAVLASVGATALSLLLPRGDVAQVLCVGLGLGYGLYLLARSGERPGRVVLVVAWVAVSLLVGAAFGGLWPQLLTQLTLVWLTRVLYFHAAPTAALLDLGLILLGWASALWALERTGSLFLAVWMFLLLQALFPMIAGRPDRACPEPPDPHPFESAERAAERALRRLSTRP